MSSLFDGLHQGLKQVLDLRSAQHALSATNIAHRDTPGYKAKELDFTNALAEAMATGDQLSARRTDARHLSLDGEGAIGAPLITHEPDSSDTDGNSVDLERENALQAENLLMNNAVTDGLSRRLAILKFAARDGR